MSEFILYFFVILNIALIFIAGRIVFNSFKEFKKSLFWVLFPDIISMFSKKLWQKDFENSGSFYAFIIYAFAFSLGNWLIFQFAQLL